MKTAETTDWGVLLSNKKAITKMNRFAVGSETTKETAAAFSNTPRASEFRKLVRNNGTTYARRLARKALRYRGLMS